MNTTSSALARILHLLSMYQDVQDKLRAELREARENYGDQPDYDQLISLPYLDAVCWETLRLYPPVPAVIRDIIDLLSVLPYYIELTLGQDTSILRMFRRLRVFCPFATTTPSASRCKRCIHPAHVLRPPRSPPLPLRPHYPPAAPRAASGSFFVTILTVLIAISSTDTSPNAGHGMRPWTPPSTATTTNSTRQLVFVSAAAVARFDRQ
ncbi:hypothetical protein D9611_005494 [Ephemerocybe angulata]|uniref:Cytochrome P450 n=1 Tax=Ephemerocybe angulata TaxID=980116 RepID=A0A8H5C1V6_9AGAR|nr:hypothetical protein D9611_005494 [Tulosesus angulatus]